MVAEGAAEITVESSGPGDGASIMGLEDGREMGKRDRRGQKRWWCKREGRSGRRRRKIKGGKFYTVYVH